MVEKSHLSKGLAQRQMVLDKVLEMVTIFK